MQEQRDQTEQAVDSSVNLSINALRVLERRYLQKDRQGQVIETPAEMFRRVARAIAAAETLHNQGAEVKAWEDEYYRLMINLEFLPNSPTLMNAGAELGQLSACFVLPLDDSMESIFEAIKNTALIHKSGGGTGFSFSRLRPENDEVRSTGGVASGPVSFMRIFDTATDVIKQGGRRRGANMAILNVNHPDIIKFINAKESPIVFTNFNLSVAVTADFMEAVKAGSDYDLVNPRTGTVVDRLKAKEVFGRIVDAAWKTGDPGIVFIDRINRCNPTPHLGNIESTNPCGEQPLLFYESCNLGSINLSKMLRRTNGATEIDWVKLAETSRTAVRFLDNVIDVNQYPLPAIAKTTKRTRKIGLGVMGFADMLILLGIPYDSEQALQIAGRVMRLISEEADKASEELAEERGVFPAFEGSIYDAPTQPKLRNATRTTIAPTGHLSLIAGCSSGIEPLYALSYLRGALDGSRLAEVNPYFEEVAKAGGFYSDELMNKLATGISLREIKGVRDDVKRLFVTAHEIPLEWHVEMQAAFQEWTDNAVSKTVNLSHEASAEDVAKVYMLAYERGLKGITVYRDRSREGQPLGTQPTPETATGVPIRARRRPETVSGSTRRVLTGCGYIYITVNSDKQGMFEVFSVLGKAGGCASAQLEAISRLVSRGMRSGLEVSEIITDLRFIRCPLMGREGDTITWSCADAIGRVLEDHLRALQPEVTPAKAETYRLAGNVAGQCPECGSLLIFQEGCFMCTGCGYTRC